MTTATMINFQVCDQCGRKLPVADDQTCPSDGEVAVDTRGLVAQNGWVCGQCLGEAEDLLASGQGYVACDYTQGDRLSDVAHGELCGSVVEAEKDRQRGRYEGVRWVGADGFLYVDRPGDA